MNSELLPEDVLFDAVPPDEREACLVYELARESKTLRLIFENCWQQENTAHLPDESPVFLGRIPIFNDNANLQWLSFRERWMPLLEWNEHDAWVDERVNLARQERRQRIEQAWPLLTSREREIFAQSNNATKANCIGSEIPRREPYFLHTPYQLLPKYRREKLPVALWPHIRRMPTDYLANTSTHSQTTSHDGEFVCLFVRWKGNSDADLAEEFAKYVSCMRPAQFKEDAQRQKPRGKKTVKAEADVCLRRLGACRVFARYKNKVSVPDSFKPVWFENAGLMRKNCQSINAIFHLFFPFLPANDKPLCLERCESLGRFNVRAGRPQKT